MSETEIHRGKLTEIKGIPKGLNYIQEIQYLQKELFTFHDLDDDGWYWMRKSDAIKINDTWFKVEDQEIEPDCDLSQFSKNPDGSYDYLVSFYNGACSLDEALKEFNIEESN